ncbi:MAG TPA: alpha-ketoglutarate-dependent dioxygenase AlkB [Acidimicrobiia bacterium]|nr:alpha-ketoglutarate-dependent dioxygenase AlkB [Acidimicrobiia bacterium]
MTTWQATLLGAEEPGVDPAVTIARVALDETSWVDVGRGWLRGADTLLETLIATVPWRQGRRHMYGRMVDDPRLTRWYQRAETLPDPALGLIRASVSSRYDVPFGAVGLNCYRDGRDSVAPHRDRELRDVDDTLVAIVTLGAARPFRLRPRAGGTSLDVHPGSGDLLVMGGRSQADWEHAVPKVRAAGTRVSISLRWARPPGTAG